MLVPCTRYQKSQKLFYLFVGTPTNRAMAFQDPLQESHIRHAKVATIKFSLHVGFTRVVVMCTDRFVETMVHTNIDGVTCNGCLIKHWGQNSLHMGATQPILNGGVFPLVFQHFLSVFLANRHQHSQKFKSQRGERKCLRLFSR